MSTPGLLQYSEAAPSEGRDVSHLDVPHGTAEQRRPLCSRVCNEMHGPRLPINQRLGEVSGSPADGRGGRAERDDFPSWEAKPQGAGLARELAPEARGPAEQSRCGAAGWSVGFKPLGAQASSRGP